MASLRNLAPTWSPSALESPLLKGLRACAKHMPWALVAFAVVAVGVAATALATAAINVKMRPIAVHFINV